jgi:hypothetical protein
VIVDDDARQDRPPDVWREPARLAARPRRRLGGLTAALGLFAGIGRFGARRRPRRPCPRGSGSLEHTADLLEQGGHAAEALARYLDTTVAEVSRGPTSLGLSAVEREEWLVGSARGTGPRLATLRQDVRAAGKRRDPRRVVEVAQSVRRWRQEMIDGPVRHP